MERLDSEIVERLFGKRVKRELDNVAGSPEVVVKKVVSFIYGPDNTTGGLCQVHNYVSIGRRDGSPEEHKPMRYVSFIHGDDAGYGVSFPDFPGCVAVGETTEAAVRHRCEALAFHVEGRSRNGDPIPQPHSIDAIKGDAELVDWCRGADIVLIPLLLGRGSSRRVNISLDRGLLEAIDDEARQRGMTRSAFLATAARNEIEATQSS